jgi:hypothetical protein
MRRVRLSNDLRLNHVLNSIIGALEVADTDGHVRQTITQSDGSGVEANQSVMLLGLP